MIFPLGKTNSIMGLGVCYSSSIDEHTRFVPDQISYFQSQCIRKKRQVHTLQSMTIWSERGVTLRKKSCQSIHDFDWSEWANQLTIGDIDSPADKTPVGTDPSKFIRLR